MRPAAYCTVCLLLGCHATTAPPSGEQDKLPNAISTPLERDGCGVELLGSWRSSEMAVGDGSWSAERGDGDESLTILAMPWKAPTLETDWREDLGAVLELRREAEEKAGRAKISEIEYAGDHQSPAGFYTSWTSEEKPSEGAITFVAASPSRLCLFVLEGPFTGQEHLSARARDVSSKSRALP